MSGAPKPRRRRTELERRAIPPAVKSWFEFLAEPFLDSFLAEQARSEDGRRQAEDADARRLKRRKFREEVKVVLEVAEPTGGRIDGQ